uniref:3-hydroxy-3-methylglutaryl CoA synthase n=1 Tax=uncultured marine thaumarchaeote KM3_74_C10 TaxID=1456270 RepID=A0A075HKR7_9ARCH|nr:3-hydroxy-3-methylglutaryl CoA synthase [uncultured marine thaumarchaeote KM3_74_C10]
MRTSVPTGIIGYGAYIPRYRLSSSEIARVWKGGAERPNTKKSVAYLDEDAITMAVEASRKAVLMASVKSLGAVLVGTESKPYAVKPSSTILAQALDQHTTLAADFEFACKAGTEAIQVVSGLVGSGMIDHGLAVAVDTAQSRPGDELEYTAASGAASFVIGRKEEDCILQIRGSTSYVTDTGDFWRRSTQMYPSHLSRFTGEPAYFHHVETATKQLFKEFDLKPADFEYAVFHQPNPRFPVEVARRLGFSSAQIETGLLNPLIGNTYAASSPLGLVAVLDEAKPGDRILLVSFGSGAGSDAFDLEALGPIAEKRTGVTTIKQMIAEGTNIDYSLYTKFRGKLQR